MEIFSLFRILLIITSCMEPLFSVPIVFPLNCSITESTSPNSLYEWYDLSAIITVPSICVTIPVGSSFKQHLKRGHTAFAYIFKGECIFGDFEMESSEKGTKIQATRMAIFGDGDLIKAYTDQKSVRFLLISGKPLNEPIARYGPFVMNTNDEIEQALRDLQNDTFVK